MLPMLRSLRLRTRAYIWQYHRCPQRSSQSVHRTGAGFTGASSLQKVCEIEVACAEYVDQDIYIKLPCDLLDYNSIAKSIVKEYPFDVLATM